MADKRCLDRVGALHLLGLADRTGRGSSAGLMPVPQDGGAVPSNAARICTLTLTSTSPVTTTADLSGSKSPLPTHAPVNAIHTPTSHARCNMAE